jgi:hypothetical protein
MGDFGGALVILGGCKIRTISYIASSLVQNNNFVGCASRTDLQMVVRQAHTNSSQSDPKLALDAA